MFNSKRIKRPIGRPIVYKNGKKVDFNVGNEDWLDENIIEKEMNYIAKMIEGLTTGTMSNDSDYVELKTKVVKNMITEKSIALRDELSKSAKTRVKFYDDAVRIQDEVLKRYHKYATEMAKDSTISIYYDQSTGDYKIENKGPVMVHNTGSTFNKGSYWHTIDLKTLGKEIDKRKEESENLKKTKQDLKDEKILEEVNEKLQKQNDCPFDLKNPNCNSKVANSKYEKALKDSKIHKEIEKKAKSKKKTSKKKRTKKSDRK